MLELLRPRSSTDNHWDPDDVPWLIGGVVAIASLLIGVAYMLDYSALDVWTGLIAFLAIVALSVPLFIWVSRKEQDPWLFKVLFWTLLLHLGFALVRYFFIFVVYNGDADAGVYHEAGTTFARRLRDGEPLHPIPIIENFPAESQRVGDVTGVLYTLTGPSAYAGFFAFSYLCFWGQVLMVRAFKAAVPEGDYRRYALVVLLLPSLLFWPASIGKEALMIGCLGIIIYGGGLLLAPRPKARGAIFFALGTGCVLLLRPHVALMSILAFGLAMAVGVLGRSASDASPGRGRAARLVALVLVVVLAATASTRLSQTFDSYGDEGGGAQAALDDTLRQSSTGNSEFTPSSITGPTKLPAGVVSVLFRPFPWEARNVNSLIAAAESLLLIGLFAAAWRRLLSFPLVAVRRPFVVFAATYTVLFCVGFSFIGNFGILARQRVQLLPIALVFIALPLFTAPRERPGTSSVLGRPTADGTPGAGTVEPVGTSSGELRA